MAQTHPVNNQAPQPVMTATASTERVRYIAAGEVHQTRLQVFSADGTQTYDSGLRLGNLIDWKLENQQGARPVDGTYLYLITIKDFSNVLTQKYGTAVLDQGQVYLEQAERAELSQAQAVALESNKLAEPLSPVDRIGAAGLNRTSATGSPDVTTAATQPTSGADTTNIAPGGENIGGTGNQNRIAKWIDNSANLGDSIMFDSGAGVGIATTDLTDVLVAGNDRFKVVDGPMTFSFRDFSGGQGYFAIGSSTNGIKGFIGHMNNVDGFTLGSFSNHKLTRLHVSRKVKGNRFEIAGGRPGTEVSWQVTGVRQDAFAEANRIPEVEIKPERERGTYLHPEAFNQKAEAAKKAKRGVRSSAGKPAAASRR